MTREDKDYLEGWSLMMPVVAVGRWYCEIMLPIVEDVFKRNSNEWLTEAWYQGRVDAIRVALGKDV